VKDVIELSSQDTLRLVVTTKLDSDVARPHQSFLLVEDPTRKLELVLPVPVKTSGKGKLDFVCIREV